MRADDFLNLLKNVRPSGDGKWMACCPAHNDGHHKGDQSLSVELRSDKLLLHCFAGCKTPDIVAQLGMTMSDLFLDKPSKPEKVPRTRGARRKIVAVYPYQGIDNKLLFEVVRYEPKGFSQRRPDGSGGYINNLDGVERVIYRLPRIRAAIIGKETVFHVEGEKDVDNLVKAGFEATTSPMGAASWKPAMSQYYEGAPLVVIIPDKDTSGRAYAREVAMDIYPKVGAVKIVELPGEGIKDASDWLTAGGTTDQLRALVDAAPLWVPPKEEAAEIDYDSLNKLLKKTSDNQYCILGGAFHRIVYDREGNTKELPLCNFVARIISDIVKDDGTTLNRHLKIQGRLNGSRLQVVTIPEAQFDSMKWVRREWGIKAQVEKSRSNEDHMVNAISKISGKVPERIIFTHTGWREINGKMCYLTAGGAIGMPEVEVELPLRLKRYVLPQPEGDPREAIEKSLEILYIADMKVTLPTLILPYLSVLNVFEDIAFTAWYKGLSGSLKSVMTALALSHFGDFTHKTLPLNWFGTITELEKLSFLAKDILFTIDDYAPPADAHEAKDLNKKVEYIIRGFGNRNQGKVRSNADLSSQATYYPRGFLATSGEQLPPPGISRSARILPISIKREDFIDDGGHTLTLLTQAQKARAAYPVAMAHYIKWIQDNWAGVDSLFHTKLEEYSGKVDKQTDTHLRTIETIALMQSGLCVLAEYAAEKKALEPSIKETLISDGWRILNDMAMAQNARISEERPGARFIEALRSLLSSRRLLLRTLNVAGTWSPSEAPPGQQLVGWDTMDDVIYFDPALTYKAVFEHCQRTGEYFGLRRDETWRDMQAFHYLPAPQDNPDEAPTLLKKLDGRPMRVLPMKREVFFQ